MTILDHLGGGSLGLYIDRHFRRLKDERRHERLRRHLARLPHYVAHDIGLHSDSDQFNKYFDT